MTNRGKSALVMVSLTVMAVIFPPAADARPTCQDTGSMTTCQTNGSVSIKARPSTVAPPANQPMFPWGVPNRVRAPGGRG
ncbi:hypothetical protein BST21_21620 [Mycolicibacterium celeriflavum]|nr:hypothetical protein BST21_21620 [Mycolicibacterium celeriflavum]